MEPTTAETFPEVQAQKDPPAAELTDSPSDVEADAEAKSGLETPEIVSRQTFELAEGVAAFLEKLAPWKPIMPIDLREEMEDIIDRAKLAQSMTVLPEPARRSRRPSPTPSPPPFRLAPEWDFDIKKQTMETWRRSHPFQMVRPCPLILTYYRTLGPASSLGIPPGDFSQTLVGKTSGIVVEQQNLQRIWIISYILHDELELLTSATLQWPLIIAPPYKLLLEFLPHLRKRLVDVKSELAEANQPENSESLEPDIERPGGEDTVPPKPDPGTQGHREDQAPFIESFAAAEETRRREGLAMRISHLECLLGFIDNSLGDLIKMKTQIADGTLERIAFDDLWHLFRPGDLVISKTPGKEHWQLYKVYFVTGGQVKRRAQTEEEERMREVSRDEAARAIGTWTAFKISTYNMAYDGNRVGPEDQTMQIKHFIGRKLITELSVYPIRFHPKKDELLASLEDRGRRFMSCLGHQFYEGLTVALLNSDNNDVVVVQRYRERSYSPPPRVRSSRREHKLQEHREDIVSEVYVDVEAYYQKFSFLKPRLGRLYPSRQDPTETSEILNDRHEPVRHYGHEVDAKLSEHFRAHNRALLEPFDPVREEDQMTAEVYQLLPHQVPAYAFRYRQWYLLDIDRLRPIDQNRYSGFKDLVIPDHYKELLVALVDNHSSGVQRRREKLQQHKGLDKAQIDLVPGKGQGLIILLHGPPGSGKTSTAETIAAYTQRPLYSITCGDIGLEPGEVEEQLEEHTAIADKWGCVLLLDEADVFLMQRTWKEIDRNALVSVFLRQLEYYSGILFLTTNRPGTIDEAFKSRIHVSLRYPSIDLASTKQMWENIMRRLEAENEFSEIQVEFDRKKLLAFAEKHYKRRQQNETTFNGRQIRNAFQTALALGHADRHVALRKAGKTAEWAAKSGKKKWMTVKLTTKNFKSIARTTKEFEDYIVSLRGKDSDAAREAEVRDDDYDPDVVPARKNYGAAGLRAQGGWGRGEGEPAVARRTASGGVKRRQGARRDLDSEDEDDEDDEDDDGEENEDQDKTGSSEDDESDSY